MARPIFAASFPGPRGGNLRSGKLLIPFTRLPAMANATDGEWTIQSGGVQPTNVSDLEEKELCLKWQVKHDEQVMAWSSVFSASGQPGMVFAQVKELHLV